MKIHPTAAVDPNALLASDVEIGPYCIIGPDVVIGEGTILMPRVTITSRVIIGRRNIFHPTCTVGGPPQDEQNREADDGRIEIGDDNVFRESTTVHAPKMRGGVTRIASRCRLLFGSHVAHDAEVGSNVTFDSFYQVGGHARIGDHSYFGPLGAIHQFAAAGRYCRSLSHTPITRDAPPYMIVGGNHYKVLGVNASVLRRDRFPEKTITALESAYEMVWCSGLPWNEAFLSLEKFPEAEVRELVAFLRLAGAGWMGRARELERASGGHNGAAADSARKLGQPSEAARLKATIGELTNILDIVDRRVPKSKR